MLAPIYTAATCSNPAFQLDWTYHLFWRDSPRDFTWLEDLEQMNHKDHIRILQHNFREPHTSQFLLSTRPDLPPRVIAQRMKGRLQRLIRDACPKAFRRNYALRSVGSTRRDKLEQYLAIQLDHHPMADPRVQHRFKDYQIANAHVDLSRPRYTSHGQYWYNLHVVLVNDGRYRELREDILQKIHRMILIASERRDHLLSSAAILPDHIHLLLGCRSEESPEGVVLSYMNNLAYVCGMKPVFKYSYFVGTFSEYDLGVIPRC